MSDETKLIQQSYRWAYRFAIMFAIFTFSVLLLAIEVFFTDISFLGVEELNLLGQFVMAVFLMSFVLSLAFFIVSLGYWFADKGRKIKDSVKEGMEAKREETKLNAKKEASEHESQREYNLALKCWIDLKKYDNDSSIYDIEIIRVKKLMADEREQARDYDSAIKIWEDLGEINEAARVRKLKAEQGAVKVSQDVQGDQISAHNVVYGDQIKAQKVVQGDEITRTDIRDSVVSRSNVGAGSSKMQELKELTEMKEKGTISYAEFRQMKKEILGK